MFVTGFNQCDISIILTIIQDTFIMFNHFKSSLSDLQDALPYFSCLCRFNLIKYTKSLFSCPINSRTMSLANIHITIIIDFTILIYTVALCCIIHILYIISASLRGQKVKPYISISSHGLAPGSFPHFRKPEKISDGVYQCVHGSGIIATTSCTLFSMLTVMSNLLLVSLYDEWSLVLQARQRRLFQ